MSFSLPHRRIITRVDSVVALSNSYTPNPAANDIVHIILDGNVTIVNPTAGVAEGNSVIELIFQQDGTGSRTITWGDDFTDVATNFTLDSAANSVSSVTFVLGTDGLWYVARHAGASTNPGGTRTFTVPLAVAVGDPVYITGSGTADEASATSISTAPCIGFVTAKPTTTTAIVQVNGFLSGAFAGLTPGSTYFLAVGGGITATPPDTVGNIIQKVGVAVTATELLINPVLDFTIR